MGILDRLSDAAIEHGIRYTAARMRAYEGEYVDMLKNDGSDAVVTYFGGWIENPASWTLHNAIEARDRAREADAWGKGWLAEYAQMLRDWDTLTQEQDRRDEERRAGTRELPRTTIRFRHH